MSAWSRIEAWLRERLTPSPVEDRRIADMEAALSRALSRAADLEAARLAERAGADRRQDALAHELRTPLNALVGFAALLARDAEAGRLDRRQAQAVERMRAAAEQLVEVSRTFLGPAVEGGGLRRLDPGLALLRAARMIGDRRLVPPPPRPGLRVLADPERLSDALAQLLPLALRGLSPDASLSLAVEPLVDGARLRLPMPGEPPLEAARLSRARRALEGWGARLSVEAGVEGRAVLIDLPGAETRACAGRGVVLYIDDNPANIALVREVVHAAAANARLHAAPDGPTGLDLARALKPDLILLDINLPEMDGWQVKAALQADPLTRAIPVAALTANARPEQARRGAAMGFVAWLTKPIDLPAFVAVLAAHLDAADLGIARLEGGALEPSLADGP